MMRAAYPIRNRGTQMSEQKTVVDRGPTLSDSYKDTGNEDACPFYARLRKTGPAVWDEKLNSWLLSSYDACKQVLRVDDGMVQNPSVGDPLMIEIAGGPGHPKNYAGEAHMRIRNWYMTIFS